MWFKKELTAKTQINKNSCALMWFKKELPQKNTKKKPHVSSCALMWFQIAYTPAEIEIETSPPSLSIVNVKHAPSQYSNFT